MKRFLALCVCAGMALTSCSKKSSNTPTSNSSDNSYQPTESASTWTYSVSEVFNPSSSILLVEAENQLHTTFKAIDTTWTSTITASGKDTVIGGLTFSVLTGDTVTQDVVVAQQGTNYYGIGIIPEFQLSGVGGLATSSPILYLKDTVANASWVQTVIDAAASDTTTYTITITGTGGSKTVNGKSYIDVTTETVSAVPSGLTALAAQAGIPTSTLAIVGTYYFAKGIGVIEVDVNAQLYGFQFTEQLQSSTIK